MLNGRIEQPILESEALRGNYFDDPITRPVTVYLPPRYDQDLTRHYPTLYILPAHGKTGQSFLNWGPWSEALPQRLDRLINEGHIPPALVVLPDSWTMLGSSQYVNSIIGRYADYLVHEILPFVEARYRTNQQRALIGHSSGGYGALLLAMQQPGHFQALACHAGDMYFEYTCLPHIAELHQALTRYGGVEQFLNDIPTLQPKNSTFWKTIMTLCWAMAFGAPPDANRFDLPIHPETGELDAAVWARWLAFDPVRMILEPPYQAALRALKGIYITAGLYDEYQLQVGARMLSQRLSRCGINHIHEEFPAGHSGSDVPYDRSFGLMLAALADEPV